MSSEYAKESLIPIELLFGGGGEEFFAPDLSPDGRHLAYLAPLDGVLNIWLRETGPDAVARPLTTGERPIRRYFWAWNSRHIIYFADATGDERYQFFALDIDSGEITVLTPKLGAGGHPVAAWGQGYFMNCNRDPSFPDEILLLTNELEARRNDIWRISLAGGEPELVQTGLPEAQRWLVDHDLRVRGYLRGEDEGATSLWLRDTGSGEFSERLRLAAGDFVSWQPLQFSADNESLYMLDATGRDTLALVELDLGTMQRTVLAADDEVDAGPSVIFHPTQHTPLAVGLVKQRLEWLTLNSRHAAALELATEGMDKDVYAYPTADPATLMLMYISSTAPVEYALLNTEHRRMIELGSSMPQLADYRFAEMQPVQLEARDGLQLHGYLTLPPGYEQPGPLVLLVHGGPTGRDQWGYSPVVQWLASRGYACLQVNFRGSTGYGKRFQAAGDRQWGAAMQDDLSDAVAWAAGQGIADPARVGIMGVSYGGYAVLAGLTLTPELYAAGVALNPVCDLEEHLRYWDALRPARRTETERRVGCLPRWTDGERAGEFKDEADWTPAERDEVEALRQRSPLHCAGRLRVPLLIGHGVADTRVREAGSARFVEACRAQGADVEYVVYQDEGHWLARPETYSDFYGRAEQLLSRTIGDR